MLSATGNRIDGSLTFAGGLSTRSFPYVCQVWSRDEKLKVGSILLAVNDLFRFFADV